MTLNEITRRLAACGIESPQNDALVLVSHFTGLGRASLMCDRDKSLDSPELEAAVRRRCEREPLQYLIGKWEFMGLELTVSPDCLIPRADTELLCELAISRTPKNGRLLDLCTGSGCIALAVAHYRPDVEVFAVEKFESTLRLAEENARRLIADPERVHLLLGDVTSEDDAERLFGDMRFDAIVSNPPYVTAGEMTSLEPELAFEPPHALTDGGDGLSIIRALCGVYHKYLKPNGLLAIEHGCDQGEAVRNIMTSYGDPRTLKDLSGLDRVTMIN